MFTDVRLIAETLQERYGLRSLGNKKNPFNELLYIILSSKTPPRRYQETYASLRAQFPRAETLAEAAPRKLEKAIRFGGLARKKARQIPAIARELRQRFGRVTLSPLRVMADQEAESLLKGLPGVGVKTARCVLLFALGRNVFPVDAHCLRIAKRVGWVHNSAPLSERTADELQAGVPRNLRRSLHVNFVLLGREFCVPSRPRCHQCPIMAHCETAQTKKQAVGHLSGGR